MSRTKIINMQIRTYCDKTIRSIFVSWPWILSSYKYTYICTCYTIELLSHMIFDTILQSYPTYGNIAFNFELHRNFIVCDRRNGPTNNSTQCHVCIVVVQYSILYFFSIEQGTLGYHLTTIHLGQIGSILLLVMRINQIIRKRHSLN